MIIPPDGVGKSAFVVIKLLLRIVQVNDSPEPSVISSTLQDDAVLLPRSRLVFILRLLAVSPTYTTFPSVTAVFNSLLVIVTVFDPNEIDLFDSVSVDDVVIPVKETTGSDGLELFTDIFAPAIMVVTPQVGRPVIGHCLVVPSALSTNTIKSSVVGTQAGSQDILVGDII